MTWASIKSFFTLRNTSYFLIAVGMFLLPVFFLPFSALSAIFAKVGLFYIAVLVAFILYAIYVFREGFIDVPWHPVFLAAALVPLAFLISAFGSPVFNTSLVGYGFEIGTIVSMFTLVLLMFLTSLLFRTHIRIFNWYILFFASVLLLSAFHILRFIFGPDVLTFGQFGSVVSNTVGSWNDLGIFFGAGLLLSLIALEMLPLYKYLRTAIHILFWLSIVFLVIINFNLVWLSVGIFALIYLIYSFSWNKAGGDEVKKVSLKTLGVLLLAIVLLLPVRGVVNEQVGRILSISNIDIRPSWSSTLNLGKTIWGKSPLLGSGPNTFSYEWLLNKPDSVNQTPFWNTNFNYGVGLVPTLAITTGLLGTASLLLFFAMFLLVGFKAIFYPSSGPLNRFVSISSFVVSAYLWLMAFLYVPSIAVVALTFFFTGLFFSSLLLDRIIPERRIELFGRSRSSFVSVLTLIVVLIASVTVGYGVMTRAVSSVYFQKAIAAANQTGDIDAAERLLLKSVNIKPNDIYYRTLSELYLVRLSNIASGIRTADITEETRFRFQQALGNAEAAALQAKDIDPSNYENWRSLGRVYDSIVPLGFPQAYDNAAAAYEEALKRNPKSPSMYVTRARLEISKGDLAKAKEFMAEALAQKPDYAEAVFLLSQIQVSEGDIAGAIASVERAALVSPNNAGIYFQLGLLRYNNKDYRGAVSALERAVLLVPNYSNAMYFLGLSYDNLNRTPEAILQFEKIGELNPDNEEVKLILGNLRAGRDPFANAEPPVDDEPEKRSEPPIEE